MDMWEELMNRVFSVELLRDKIMGYVITEDGEGTSGSDIRSCRLVQKSWLESVSRCLRKSGRPLFGLRLINPPYRVRTRRLSPEEFVSAVTGPSRLEDQVPPFKVWISDDYFRSENLKGLQELLVRCGDGLIELVVHFPNDGGSMPFFFPNLSFPWLRRFRILFCHAPWSGRRDDSTVFGNQNNAVYLMNPVLSGCTKLNEYHLDSGVEPSQRIPVCFDHLAFPSTISELKIETVMAPKHLEVLLREPLPGLKTLHLLIPDTPLPNGLIFRILRHVRTTLSSFKAIMELNEERLPLPRTLFRLPLMDKLKKMELKSMRLELEENLESLELCLPALERLTFEDSTKPMLSKWIKNSIYSTVTYLSISVSDENFAYNDDEYYVNISVESMPHLQTAFPNLKVLDLLVADTEQRVIQFIFRELKQLEKLRLWYIIFPVLHTDFIDGLLTGIPVESLATLRENPSLWEGPNGQNGNPPSIRNLTELKELHLGADSFDSHFPIISDASFHFAFLQMEKLEKLVLWGGFIASREMELAWEAQGRTISREFQWE